MGERHDILVIGTGPAGATAAVEAAAAGLDTAVADRGPYGGTCTLRGCNPKKVMVGAADLVDRFNRMTGKGIRGECMIDWPGLVRFQSTFTDPVPESRERSFRKRGISTYHGEARFVSPDTVDIGGRRVRAGRLVIATGAEPRPLDIEGAELLTTSDRFLAAESLPGLILFAGGGYVSFELAYIASRAGSSAIILESSDRPLTRFDPQLVQMLVDECRETGIAVHLDAPVHAVKRLPEMLLVTTGRHDNKLFEARMVVHGAGRVPATADLDLERGGVEADGRSILINEHLQSVSNPAVYVAGDANASGIPLTPPGEMEARAAVRNIVEGNAVIPDYRGVPSVLFTEPKLAAVGLSEADARAAHPDCSVLFRDTSKTKSTRRLGYTRSAMKLVLDADGETILGAHLLGHNVDETVNLFALAVRLGIGVSGLKKLECSFPTVSYNLLRYL